MTSPSEVPDRVDSAQWVALFRGHLRSGCTFFDFLTAHEAAAGITIVARVLNTTSGHAFLHSTVLASTPTLGSLTDVYPGATWHEREAAEMFGVRFDGLIDIRPLLRHEPGGQAPMLKSTVLAARGVKAWPGAAEPDVADGRRVDNPSRRRLQPPGAPPSDWRGARG